MYYFHQWLRTSIKFSDLVCQDVPDFANVPQRQGLDRLMLWTDLAGKVALITFPC